jgi:hypothetical protein
MRQRILPAEVVASLFVTFSITELGSKMVATAALSFSNPGDHLNGGLLY